MKVILRLTARPGAIDDLKRILIGLVGPTRQETGCTSYEVFQNNADPCDFTLIEEWRDQATLDAHWASPHVQDALAKGVPLLAAPPDDRRYSKIA
jgi:quinol monooxygenase YgiN